VIHTAKNVQDLAAFHNADTHLEASFQTQMTLADQIILPSTKPWCKATHVYSIGHARGMPKLLFHFPYRVTKKTSAATAYVASGGQTVVGQGEQQI
jgi:hypothetical protein